jgi:hypothetical protein
VRVCIVARESTTQVGLTCAKKMAASVCCIEGCLKESSYESTALKRDVPMKPNVANKTSKTFGLCLDHFISESNTPAWQGRLGRGSNASVEEEGSEDGVMGDEYNMGGNWADEVGTKV